MAVAGGLTPWPVIRVLPDVVRLFGYDDSFARDFGLLLLAVWVVLGLFGCACLLLAWRLAHADQSRADCRMYCSAVSACPSSSAMSTTRS